jgi:hypothetical protein
MPPKLTPAEAKEDRESKCLETLLTEIEDKRDANFQEAERLALRLKEPSSHILNDESRRIKERQAFLSAEQCELQAQQDAAIIKYETLMFKLAADQGVHVERPRFHRHHADTGDKAS